MKKVFVFFLVLGVLINCSKTNAQVKYEMLTAVGGSGEYIDNLTKVSHPNK